MRDALNTYLIGMGIMALIFSILMFFGVFNSDFIEPDTNQIIGSVLLVGGLLLLRP